MIKLFLTKFGHGQAAAAKAVLEKVTLQSQLPNGLEHLAALLLQPPFFPPGLLLRLGRVLNGLWYELIGGYYLPCLTVPAEGEKSVGVWSQRHKQYLKAHRPAFYNALLLSGKLNGCLADINQRAQELFDTIIQQMTHAQGITETLKAAGQMARVGTMNNLRASAMEIVSTDIIYS